MFTDYRIQQYEHFPCTYICLTKPFIATPIAPTPPRLLTMSGEPTGSTIELNWLPPLHPNGAIHYEIEYEPAMTPGDPVNAESSSPYFTLTVPNEFLTYNCNVKVAAVNTHGLGAAQSSALPLCLGKNNEEGVQLVCLCTWRIFLLIVACCVSVHAHRMEELTPIIYSPKCIVFCAFL